MDILLYYLGNRKLLLFPVDGQAIYDIWLKWRNI